MFPRFLFRLLSLIGLFVLAFIFLIKVVYRCSWRESFEIANQFAADLLE